MDIKNCEGVEMKKYIITKTTNMGRQYVSRELTLPEAVEYYSYTLEVGYSRQHERGNKKINKNPKTIKSLMANLNNAANNAAANGCGETYTMEEFGV